MAADVSVRASDWPPDYTGARVRPAVIFLISILSTGSASTHVALTDFGFHRAGYKWQQAIATRARTELWRRLSEIRARIVASGEPLLDWDGVRREVRERRGGAQWSQ